MISFKSRLFAATLIAGIGAGSIAALAQTSPYDAAQLPQTKGKVAQYLLNPMGMVDGLLLADGTEVQTSPRASTELVFAVRPGDAVTIHGLKARATPMVAAASVTNDATGATVQIGAEPRMREARMGGEHGKMHDRHMGGQMGGMMELTQLDVTGVVKAVLHTPRGDAGGVVLADGTQIRLPPPEAKRLGDQLAVGKSIAVKGPGSKTLLGTVLIARQIGPDAQHLTDVQVPHGRMGDHRPAAPAPAK